MSDGHNFPHRLARNASQMRKRPSTTMSMASLHQGCRSGSLPGMKSTSDVPGIGGLRAAEGKPTSRLARAGLDAAQSRAPPRGRRPSSVGTSTKLGAGDTACWSAEKRNAILARQTDWISDFCGHEADALGRLALGPRKAPQLGSTFPPPRPGRLSKLESPVHGQSLPVLHNIPRMAAGSEEQQVSSLAAMLNLPLERASSAYRLFKDHADSPGEGASLVDESRLTKTQFGKLACAMTGCHSEDDLPAGIVDDAFKSADKDGGGEIDFSEFAIWFTANSFSERLTLDAGQRALRKLARTYSMSYAQVDQYKQHFDKFDLDRSGMIESDEFQNLLCKCAKIPASGLAHSRVQQLWRAADADGSGEVDFEEFLVFYRKYFDVAAGEGAGFENFYRGVRSHPWA
mmetsp:Transcript_42052/g.118912  ORF Transcript_42052/g.118912 Transcript_42052/m.118912 type:complete len:401 (-) Transcript_42052:347-1549(-)